MVQFVGFSPIICKRFTYIFLLLLKSGHIACLARFTPISLLILRSTLYVTANIIKLSTYFGNVWQMLLYYFHTLELNRKMGVKSFCFAFKSHSYNITKCVFFIFTNTVAMNVFYVLYTLSHNGSFILETPFTWRVIHSKCCSLNEARTT
jgi:hypothetical protein